MGAIMNASSQEQRVKVLGNWFTFQPKQIKIMEDRFSRFLALERQYMGFVEVPMSVAEDVDYRNSPEGKKIIAEALKRGIASRVDYLKRIVYNERVSLQHDLDMAGIKTDAIALSSASPALENSLTELAGYEDEKTDEVKQRAKRVEELQKKLEKLGG